MPTPQPRTTVLKVDGPIILDFGNGVRIRLEPASPTPPSAPAKGRPGRKPNPATMHLIQAMQTDAQNGGPRSRSEYVQLLQKAGGPASAGAAGQIVLREAKRIFGGPLGHNGKPGRRAKTGGKQASVVTMQLRQKLAQDHAADALGDAGHYTRWLVQQPGNKLGLKQARPLVYRELRKATE